MPATWWHDSMLLMNFRSFVAFSGLSSLSSPKQIPAARHRRNAGSVFKAIVNYCECYRGAFTSEGWDRPLRLYTQATPRTNIYLLQIALIPVCVGTGCLCVGLCGCVGMGVYMCASCIIRVSRFVHKGTNNPSSRNSVQ